MEKNSTCTATALPRSSIKWFVASFGLPILLIAYALFKFYTTAPLVFAKQEDLTMLQQEILLAQERYLFLQRTLDRLIRANADNSEAIQKQIEKLRDELMKLRLPGN